MNNNQLQEIINNTKTNNKIKWNNESISYQVSLNAEYSTYIFNKDGQNGSGTKKWMMSIIDMM